MNMVPLFQREYWDPIADTIWIWLQREIITEQSLINLMAIVAGVSLA